MWCENRGFTCTNLVTLICVFNNSKRKKNHPGSLCRIKHHQQDKDQAPEGQQLTTIEINVFSFVSIKKRSIKESLSWSCHSIFGCSNPRPFSHLLQKIFTDCHREILPFVPLIMKFIFIYIYWLLSGENQMIFNIQKLKVICYKIIVLNLKKNGLSYP